MSLVKLVLIFQMFKGFTISMNHYEDCHMSIIDVAFNFSFK